MNWDFSLGTNLAFFCIGALAVWMAGTQLAIVADEISDRRKMGKAIMGLVFLAAATELPEIVTTLFAALEGEAVLLLNNMFGGIALQTAILVFADLTAANVAITQYPRKPMPIIEGLLLILILALLHAIILVGDVPLVGHIGVGSVLLVILYIWSMNLLRVQDKKTVWLPVEMPEHPARVRRDGLLGSVTQEKDLLLYMRFAIAAATVLIFGIVLVVSAEQLADQTGLGKSFIGATLLAGSTSLPELSTTIMAVRLRSYTMAISNIFGSNLIMVALILPADIFFTKGPLLQFADASATFAIVCGIIVTAIYVIGLTIRGPGRIFGIGYDSAAVLGTYIASLFVLYSLK